MAAIPKFESIQSLFVGQGSMVVFGDPTTGEFFASGKDYSNATLADLINPRDLGQVVEDSSNWTGDDVTFNQIKDEQGELITVTVTAGTLGFEFDLASTSAAMIKKFLKGVDITGSLASVFGSDPAGSAVGFGHALPVFTAPIAWINDEMKRALLFPKAKISANFANSDKLMRIHVTVMAENVDTANLKTGMIIDGGTAATVGE